MTTTHSIHDDDCHNKLQIHSHSKGQIIIWEQDAIDFWEKMMLMAWNEDRGERRCWSLKPHVVGNWLLACRYGLIGFDHHLLITSWSIFRKYRLPVVAVSGYAENSLFNKRYTATLQYSTGTSFSWSYTFILLAVSAILCSYIIISTRIRPIIFLFQHSFRNIQCRATIDNTASLYLNDMCVFFPPCDDLWWLNLGHVLVFSGYNGEVLGCFGIPPFQDDFKSNSGIFF